MDKPVTNDDLGINVPYIVPHNERGDVMVDIINNLTHTSGKSAAKPFNLRRWQEALIRLMTGLLEPDTGLRQIRTVFIMIPRKNGKTELMAALMLALLIVEEQIGKQMYGLANSREQASLMFDAAKIMVENDDELSAHLEVIPSKKRIVNHATKSFYCALPADAARADGYNTYCYVYDEIHAAPKRDLWDLMKTSTGTQEEPLKIAITTAGHDTNSICYELYEYAKKVRDGVVDDPTFLPVIYEADEEDDWQDEQVWHKANPALGDFRKIEEMRTSMAEALHMPARENVLRRLYLNQWTSAETLWISPKYWAACAVEFAHTSMHGKECFGGLDLSSTTDISSLSLYFPDDDHRVININWLPKDRLKELEDRDHVPYAVWEKQGFLRTTPGNVLDYDRIRNDINDMYKVFNIRLLAVDRWNSTQITTQLDGDGLEMAPTGQGYRDMNAACKELDRLIVSAQLQHDGNPLLAWAASNTMVEEDAAGNIKPDKGKSTKKIDPIVSLVNAVACSLGAPEQKESIYVTQGLMTL